MKKSFVPSKHSPDLPETQSSIPGLCSTCAEAGTCSWLHQRGPAMVACEEFRVTDIPPLPAPPATQTVAVATEARAGLCATCARAGDCALPSATGGIWFCEEFV